MNEWRDAFHAGLRSGAAASVLSTAALLAAGRKETGWAAAPTNATSQWIWGRPALRVHGVTWRHTVTGYLIHHTASVFWATLHVRANGPPDKPRSPGRALAEGLLTAAVACFVDFRLTPKRLTPGFEHRLSRRALFCVYAAFGVGLALHSLSHTRTGPSRHRPRARRA